MRRHIAKNTKHLLIPSIFVTVGVILVATSVYASGVLLSLPKTKQDNYSYKYDHYTYNIEQHPGVIISGEPVTFHVHVEDTDGPIKNHGFTASITHAYGVFMASRPDELVDRIYSTDAQGNFSFTYQSHFFDLLADGAFGVIVTPIRTPEEQAQYDREIQAYSADKVGVHAHSLTIYPKWIGWFRN